MHILIQNCQHQPSANTQMFVWTHGHTQPQPFMCHGLTKSNRTHKQYTLECDTVRVLILWIYSLFSLPLSSSSLPPFSFFPPWSGRGAASCAQALLLGHFCPTLCPTELQARGSNRDELHTAQSQHALVTYYTPGRQVDPNPCPSCCGATVLSATLTCQPQLYILIYSKYITLQHQQPDLTLAKLLSIP